MKLQTIAGPLIACALLGVLLGLNQTHLSPEDAQAYHAAVRDAVLEIPRQIDGWQGTDQEVPAAAIELLRPNVLLSRRYTHQETGQVVTLLIVHCKDARDLMGHYPPVCYPAQGWRIIEQYKPMNRIFEKEQVSSDWARYALAYGAAGGQTGQVMQIVYNQMLLPDGSATTQMDQVQTVSGDFQRRHFGAAALQIIVNEGPTSNQGDSLKPLLEALEPFAQAVFSVSESSD